MLGLVYSISIDILPGLKAEDSCRP